MDLNCSSVGVCIAILAVILFILVAVLVNLVATGLVIYMIRKNSKRLLRKEKIRRWPNVSCEDIQISSCPAEPAPSPPTSSSIQQSQHQHPRHESSHPSTHDYEMPTSHSSDDEDGIVLTSSHLRPDPSSLLSENYYSLPREASILLENLRKWAPWHFCDSGYEPFDPALTCSDSGEQVYENDHDVCADNIPKRPERHRAKPLYADKGHEFQVPCIQESISSGSKRAHPFDDIGMYENGARTAVIPSLQDRVSDTENEHESTINISSATERTEHNIQGASHCAVCLDPPGPGKVHWSRRSSPKEYPKDEQAYRESKHILWASMLNFLENIVESCNQELLSNGESGQTKRNSARCFSRQNSESSIKTSTHEIKLESRKSGTSRVSLKPVMEVASGDETAETINDSNLLVERVPAYPESASPDLSFKFDSKENEQSKFKLKRLSSERVSTEGNFSNSSSCQESTEKHMKSIKSLNDSISNKPDGASAGSLMKNVQDEDSEKDGEKPNIPPRPYKRPHADVMMSKWKEKAMEKNGKKDKVKFRANDATKGHEQSFQRKTSHKRSKRWQVSMTPTFTYGGYRRSGLSIFDGYTHYRSPRRRLLDSVVISPKARKSVVRHLRKTML